MPPSSFPLNQSYVLNSNCVSTSEECYAHDVSSFFQYSFFVVLVSLHETLPNYLRQNKYLSSLHSFNTFMRSMHGLAFLSEVLTPHSRLQTHKTDDCLAHLKVSFSVCHSALYIDIFNKCLFYWIKILPLVVLKYVLDFPYFHLSNVTSKGGPGHSPSFLLSSLTFPFKLPCINQYFMLFSTPNPKMTLIGFCAKSWRLLFPYL